MWITAEPVRTYTAVSADPELVSLLPKLAAIAAPAKGTATVATLKTYAVSKDKGLIAFALEYSDMANCNTNTVTLEFDDLRGCAGAGRCRR